MVNGQAQQRDGECVIEIKKTNAISIRVSMPAGHDWH